MQYRYLSVEGELMKTILRPALTMIELILVIIILGIVASIGAEIIANIYESYIIQRAQHRASMKTELAAIQIANRLAYAIPGTVVRKSGRLIRGTDINEAGNNADTILQWVGADADSFKAMSVNDRAPGWSGFCDIDASAFNLPNISTPGSNIPLVNTIRGNLNLTSDLPRIYFQSENNLVNYQAVGVSGNDAQINLRGLRAGGRNTIVEHYKVALSSYALQATANGELWLYYNFNPVRDADIAGNSQLLLRNVSTFRFRGDGRTIRFKICVDENIGDSNITICKEKAVF